MIDMPPPVQFCSPGEFFPCITLIPGLCGSKQGAQGKPEAPLGATQKLWTVPFGTMAHTSLQPCLQILNTKEPVTVKGQSLWGAVSQPSAGWSPRTLRMKAGWSPRRQRTHWLEVEKRGFRLELCRHCSPGLLQECCFASLSSKAPQ